MENSMVSAQLSFQNFLHSDPEPQESLDSHHSSDNSDNDDDDIGIASDGSLEKQLWQLMLQKNPQNASRKKPVPKCLSSQHGWSTDIPHVDAYDPHTCGMQSISFFYSLLDFLYRFQYLCCSEEARWQQLPIHSPLISEI
jgi:hypothetical protein